MEVRLAGFNVDTEVLARLNAGGREVLTPETLSAAYARISRSQKSVPELRRDAVADVAKARKSSQSIIFDMGHHSVAEHAVFNLDVLGVSRIALEALESFRLASYTEKSQRYVTLKGDFVLPEELAGTPDEPDFLAHVERMNEGYRRSLARLLEFHRARRPDLAATPAGGRLLEGMAKEDARYFLPLATCGQVGMTLNARSLEHLFRRFSLSPYQEVRRLGREIHALIEPVAPSLILFPTPSSFEVRLDQVARRLPAPAAAAGEPFRLVRTDGGGDRTILAALIARVRGCGFASADAAVETMAGEEILAAYRDLFTDMAFFDTPPREFELVRLTFEAVVSAAAFAQLKRHRMATLLPGPYDPGLGVTVPPALHEAGLTQDLLDLAAAANRMHRRLEPRRGPAADYVLSGGHRRRVVMEMNLREVYHFVRLRDDEHAQWDIRGLAASVGREAIRHLPGAALMLCGKSDFSVRRGEIYGPLPREP